MSKVINWFEIPVLDFERAKKFYSTILNIEMPVKELGVLKVGIFLDENNNHVGAIIEGDGFDPSPRGVLVYLYAGEDLNEVLKRVEPAGGKILVPKTEVSEYNRYFAFILDTEGNKIGLHSHH